MLGHRSDYGQPDSEIQEFREAGKEWLTSDTLPLISRVPNCPIGADCQQPGYSPSNNPSPRCACRTTHGENFLSLAWLHARHHGRMVTTICRRPWWEDIGDPRWVWPNRVSRLGPLQPSSLGVSLRVPFGGVSSRSKGTPFFRSASPISTISGFAHRSSGLISGTPGPPAQVAGVA